MYENAIRYARGETLDEHLRVELWSRFNEAGLENPNASTDTPGSEEIRTPTSNHGELSLHQNDER